MSLLDRWLARQLAGQLSQLVSWPAGRLAAWLPASPPVRLSGLLVADQERGCLQTLKNHSIVFFTLPWTPK